MRPPFPSIAPAVLGGLLAIAAAPVAAFTITLDTDAFNLAAVLAPAPGTGVAVTGKFVEVGTSSTGQGAIGSFTDGLATIGIESGVVLSNGDVAEIFTGAPPTSGVDFGWTPADDTAALLSRVPGKGAGLFDSARLSLTIDPGFDAVFINFDLAFGTNEAGIWNDRIGVFVNGGFLGLLLGAPLNQDHPWTGPAGSGFGFNRILYPLADVLAAPMVTVAVPVPSAGSPFTLDFIVADVGDGTIDSALFLGNLRGSDAPLGPVLVPAVPPLALWLAALPALLLVQRRSSRLR